MKSIKIYYKFCLQIILIYLLNNVQFTSSQLLANLLANNKPIHSAASIQQTARAAALNAASLSRSDFKQPKLDKRNIWTPISNLNNQDHHNQTSTRLSSIPTTTTPSSLQRTKQSTSNPSIKQTKSQALTDMLKAKLQEGRLAKKSLVDVDLPESNLRLVFDLNNLDKLQTQSTQESSQKLQKSSSSKTNTNSKTNTASKTSSNLVAGTKGGAVKGANKSNKSELKSVREQLRLLNNQNNQNNSQNNKTTSSSSSSSTNPSPQHFHIGFIRASDLRKVINSGFSINDVPADISNNQTERPVAARLVKPAPAKIQSKTSTKSNLEDNDLETISQKDISQKLTLEKKATRKQMISPKQAHFGLRDQKKNSANLIADTKGSSGSKSTATSDNETNSGATKSTKSGTKSTAKQQQQQQQQLNSGTKGGGVKGKSKRPSVSSRSVPFSTTTSPTTQTPTTTVQPTTSSSSQSANNEIESEGNDGNTETTTTLSSLFARMAASLSSMTTTTSPTTIEQNIQSNELSAAALSNSITTTSSPDNSASSSSDGLSQTTNSPSTSATASNLISSNDQQQKDVENTNEESNSTDGNEDDEDQNNSLAAIAEQLNSNYGGFGMRNRLLQQNSTPSDTKRPTTNSGNVVNNLMINNLVANTKGSSRAVVSLQPLNLKTSAFVVEDSQSTTTNNNDNEGLIEVKEDKSSKTTQQPIKQETDSDQTVTDNSLNTGSNNDEEEFTLISNTNNDQSDGHSGRLNQGVLIQRTSSGKAIKFAVNNNATHSALRSGDSETADDYEDGFEDINEVEIIDTSKPNQAAAVFAGNGSPLIIRPFPLSATCACAPLTTINNVLYSGTSSQNIGKRLRILAKELGAENLFIKFPQTEQHLQKRLEKYGQEGYTLFLPSDEALDKLPLNLIHHWEKRPEELARVLDNHIVHSEPHKLASLLELKTLTSIANNNSSTSVIRFNHYRNDTFTANGARVIYGDQTAPNNGVLHILDGMLYPLADKNILDTLKSCNKFDGFVTLAQGTGLSDTLIQPGPFTLFVPSNEALQKIPDIDLDLIRNNMTALKEFLSYHIVNGSYYSNDLRDGQWVQTLLGDNQIQVGIRVDHCSRRLIDANVSPLYKTDIPASNGLIHIVDWILRPSDNNWCESAILPR